jgi:hypothetical protein
MEDIIGGHIWIGLTCIVGGFWHILTKPFAWARRAYVWSGEVVKLRVFHDLQLGAEQFAEVVVGQRVVNQAQHAHL